MYGKDIEKRPGNPDPKRLIFFRGKPFHLFECSTVLIMRVDGVSEGQFQQVLDIGMHISLSTQTKRS